MKSMKMSLWLMCALAALFVCPFASQAEEAGIGDWGVNDAVYGLKTRENEPGFTYTPSPADWRDINIYQLFTDRFADSGTTSWQLQARVENRRQEFSAEPQLPPRRRLEGAAEQHSLSDRHGREGRLDFRRPDERPGQGRELHAVPPVPSGQLLQVRSRHGHVPGSEGADRRPARRRHLRHPRRGAEPHVRQERAVGQQPAGRQAVLANGNGTFGWWNQNNKHPAPFDNLAYFHNNGTINNWDARRKTCWGQFKGTDDLKTEDAAVQSILSKAFKNLIDATDCDGFRVDAIKHMEYNWNKQWADDMRKHAAYRGKNDFILFGELFSYDNNALASWCKDAGYSYNSALFFPLSQNIKSVFVDGGWPNQLTQQLNNKSLYGEGADRLVAFIDNHDLNRIALMNGGDAANDVWKLRPAL
jgi:hypothetical protein